MAAAVDSARAVTLETARRRMIMSLTGIGLMLGNWVSLAALALIPTAGLLFRIRAEERVLLAGLGEPYRRFLTTRARLVPGIW